MTVVTTTEAEAATLTKSAPPRFDVARRLLRNRRVIAGLAIIGPFAFMAVCFPILPFKSSTASSLDKRLARPSLENPFGTDVLGRDLLARTIDGARISLLVGVTVAIVAVTAGILIGTLAGYFGGWLDSLVSGVTNVFLSFPGLLIGLLVVAVFGPGVWQIIAAISIAFIPRAIRLQRASVLGIRGRPYMDAARLVSASSRWILVRHIIPNTLSPMLVVGSIYTADAILIEATISFTGYGIVPPTPSWGTNIRDGQAFLQEAWWITLVPAMCLVLFAVGLHLVADGARQVIDPSEHAGSR